MQTPAPDVTVVIVNYETRDDTVACVASVLEHLDGVDAQVVVVDNGSRDGSAAALRAAHPGIDVVEAGENLGFARAVNRGAALARGEFVLLLNPDALMLEHSLPRLIGFARENPQYRIVGGRTLRADLTLEPSSCWGAPTLWSLSMYATMLSTVFRRSRLFDPESLGTWQRDTIREVPIITGCLLLIRRDDFVELGGMDEDFFLYGEDAEFSMRAAARGMARVVYPPAAIIHTVGGSSARQLEGLHGARRQGHLPREDLAATASGRRGAAAQGGCRRARRARDADAARRSARGRPSGAGAPTGHRATRTPSPRCSAGRSPSPPPRSGPGAFRLARPRSLQRPAAIGR